MNKAMKKSRKNQVQTQRRQLDVGELEQVYGGRAIADDGTKSGHIPSI